MKTIELSSHAGDPNSVVELRFTRKHLKKDVNFDEEAKKILALPLPAGTIDSVAAVYLEKYIDSIPGTTIARIKSALEKRKPNAFADIF